MKSVDLRYNPEGVYTFSAKGTESYTFQVKSTDVWKVYGKSNWCAFTPNEGAQDEICDVVITCNENTGLDNRTDTVTIQSDYWIGTRFVIFQKGTAYLIPTPTPDTPSAGEGEDRHVYLNKEGTEKAVIDVASNQKWSVSIPEEVKWLRTDKASGENNGQITVEVDRNGGEQRECFVTLLDRNGDAGEPPVGIRIVQEGILLLPDKDYSRVQQRGEEIVFNITSNGKWKSSKANSEDDWYSITSPTDIHTGNGELKLNVNANSSQAFNVAEIILETVPDDDSEPVIKKVRIKQGYEPVADEYDLTAQEGSRWNKKSGTVTFDGDASFGGGAQLSRPAFPIGTYNFYLKSMTANATPFINFCIGQPGWNEVTFYLRGATKIADARTYPWAPGTDIDKKDVDIAIPHVLTVKFSDKQGQINIEWWFDGEHVTTHWGKYVSGSYVFDWPTDAVQNSIEVFFGLNDNNGSCVFDKYTYSAPLDWEDGL